MTVALIGNPNCGKTTVFNLLTGAHQTVGNWPGVTVEQKQGTLRSGGLELKIIDLPGVYSLGGGGGLDEAIARDYVLSGDADLLVNIIDTSNLERQLGLTVELLDSETPMFVILNMIDEAEKLGRLVDPVGLSNAIGCPVLPLVASRPGGKAKLLSTLTEAASRLSSPRRIEYPEPLETGVTQLEDLLPRETQPRNRRATAIRLLDGGLSSGALEQPLRSIIKTIEEVTGENPEDLIADTRFRFAQRLVDCTLRQEGVQKRTWSNRIDRLVLNRFFAVPIFFLIMYLLFVVSFSGGNIFLDFIDGMSHALFVNLPGWILTNLHAPTWTIQLVATAVGGAIQLVLPFMAPVGLTFLFLTILEESGYMARGTFIMDRFLRRIGLPGKTVVPMVVGLGCNVPAVMATRSIEDPRDRLVVTMMQPFMSCSARLVIYMAFAAVFFRSNGGQVVFGLYLVGIAMAILTALLLGKTVLKGEAQPFVLDLPPYRFPTLRTLCLAVWHRLKIYIWRVGRVIATATVFIYLLSSFAIGPTGVVTTTDPSQSALGQVGQAMTPVFSPMGIQRDNWPATVGLLTGAVAKEVVIGTLNGAYARSQAQELPDYNVDVPREMWDALVTIPVNAASLFTNLMDPLGLKNLSQSQNAAAFSGASQTTLRALAANFTSVSATAYLIFVLLYIPCVSTMGAIRRETGSWLWTIFAIVWGVIVAFGLATIWYQSATMTLHPWASVFWVAGIAVLVFAVVRTMHWMGLHKQATAQGWMN